MAESSYELLSMGLRYWFVLLIVLALLRAYFLMRRDNRDYRQALRQLPDAGLIGEVVDLHTGTAQPLPREGLMGSSRSCDIRHPGMHRREMEFIFRPGFGVKLIPIHRKHRALLDNEPLQKGDDFALHGTVLDLPAIVGVARELIAGAGMAERVSTRPGDYHTAPFEGPWDVLTFFGVLHQEPPDTIACLMRSAYAALAPGGRIFVLDLMTDDTHAHPPFAALFALNMALTMEHGWVFSEREMAGWLAAAGFGGIGGRPVPPPMPHVLMTARKS